jgi:hypothetical protein
MGVATQILANVDSRNYKHGHVSLWQKSIRAISDVLVLSDNLHELRAYNKLSNLASGSVLFMMQDDMVPSEGGCAWMSNTADIFKAHSDTIAAVSTKNGLFSIGLDDVEDSFAFINEDGGPRCYDPATNTKLEAIRCVDVGPLVRHILLVGLPCQSPSLALTPPSSFLTPLSLLPPLHRLYLNNNFWPSVVMMRKCQTEEKLGQWRLIVAWKRA